MSQYITQSFWTHQGPMYITVKSGEIPTMFIPPLSYKGGDYTESIYSLAGCVSNLLRSHCPKVIVIMTGGKYFTENRENFDAVLEKLDIPVEYELDEKMDKFTVYKQQDEKEMD